MKRSERIEALWRRAMGSRWGYEKYCEEYRKVARRFGHRMNLHERSLIKQGKVVWAVKSFKDRTGCSLKEAIGERKRIRGDKEAACQSTQ